MTKQSFIVIPHLPHEYVIASEAWQSHQQSILSAPLSVQRSKTVEQAKGR